MVVKLLCTTLDVLLPSARFWAIMPPLSCEIPLAALYGPARLGQVAYSCFISLRQASRAGDKQLLHDSGIRILAHQSASNALTTILADFG